MSNDPHADLIYRWDLHGDQPQGINLDGNAIKSLGSSEL